MSRLYLKRHETRTNSHAYAMINGVNMLTAYSMELLTYDTGTPEPAILLIEVPGRPGKLDATLALNGKVNYTVRPVSATFHIRDITQDAWMLLKAELMKLFNGTESKIAFSPDPGWYYKGRFKVTFTRDNATTGQILFECTDAFPYKLEEVEITGTCTSTLTLTAEGKDYNGPVTINSTGVAQVTFDGTTYNLIAGDNLLPEIHLQTGANTFSFASSATRTVKIKFERGVL